MRLGVLDIGSNTGHLLVVDAHDGRRPAARRTPTRSRCGSPSTSTTRARSPDAGIDALADFVASALEVAEDKGCEDMLAFATSAVRDASNSDDVLAPSRTGPASRSASSPARTRRG